MGFGAQRNYLNVIYRKVLHSEIVEKACVADGLLAVVCVCCDVAGGV